MAEENIMDILFQERVRYTLEEKLETSSVYMETREMQRKADDKLSRVELSEKQKKAVDQVVSASNSSGWAYGEVAYRQGFADGIRLVSELKGMIE